MPICRPPILAIALSVFGCASCSQLSDGDRVRYAVKGIRAACVIDEKYPDRVPQEYKAELQELCLALGTARE